MENSFIKPSNFEIDGQRLAFYTNQDWNIIVEMRAINDIVIPNGVITRLTKVELPLALKYPEFMIGVLAEKNEEKSRVIFYSLINFNNHYQRIDVRGAKCKSCNWSGYIGNPLASDIYFGISNDLEPYTLMRKAKEYPKAICPMCGSEFNQFAIWAGELS